MYETALINFIIYIPSHIALLICVINTAMTLSKTEDNTIDSCKQHLNIMVSLQSSNCVVMKGVWPRKVCNDVITMHGIGYH